MSKSENAEDSNQLRPVPASRTLSLSPAHSANRRVASRAAKRPGTRHHPSGRQPDPTPYSRAPSPGQSAPRGIPILPRFPHATPAPPPTHPTSPPSGMPARLTPPCQPFLSAWTNPPATASSPSLRAEQHLSILISRSVIRSYLNSQSPAACAQQLLEM